MTIWSWLSLLSLVVSVSSLVFIVWFARTHWPANGFVRVPKHLAREREEKHLLSESLSDRTIAPPRDPASGAHVRTARMRGRRMQ